MWLRFLSFIQPIMNQKTVDVRRPIIFSPNLLQDKKLQNQFSFVERATQTMNNALKGDDVQTEPPPRANFSDTGMCNRCRHGLSIAILKLNTLFQSISGSFMTPMSATNIRKSYRMRRNG